MKNFFLLVLIFSFIGCESSSSVDALPNKDLNKIDVSPRIYGVSLNNFVEIQSFQNSTLYRPKVIEQNVKLPVVLFVPGWESKEHSSYQTILTFIANQGYVVIYSKCPGEYSANKFIKRFSRVLEDENVSKYIDKQNIGLIGHSSGGGLSFKIMDYFSKNGYGDEGRFIFSMDPWFAFEMGEDDFKNFPKNTKVIIQQYMKDSSQDPRIALTIFDKLSVVGDKNRDYQVYDDLTHGYPVGGVSNDEMQIILKPLDALMDYVFNKEQNAYKVSMKLGVDNPSENPVQKISSIYDYYYKCYGELDSLKLVLEEYKINYCSIIPLQNN